MPRFVMPGTLVQMVLDTFCLRPTPFGIQSEAKSPQKSDLPIRQISPHFHRHDWIWSGIVRKIWNSKSRCFSEGCRLLTSLSGNEIILAKTTGSRTKDVPIPFREKTQYEKHNEHRTLRDHHNPNRNTRADIAQRRI